MTSPAFAAALIFILTALPAASAQGGLADSVESLVRQAEVVRGFGTAANTHLRTMRREDPELALPILKLRRQANAATAVTKADTGTVKAACVKWVGIARVLLRFGVDVSAALDKKMAAATVEDKELLAALDRAIHVARAKEEIKKFTGKGTYSGMFDSLRPRAGKIAPAFLFLFRDRLEDAIVRGFAAEGLAQLCPQDQRKPVRAAVTEIYQEKDETPFIKDTAMIILARLGDRKLLNKTLAEHRTIIATELAKRSDAERSFPKMLLSYEKISDLLQRVGDIGKAAEVNTDYLRMIFNLCRFQTQNAMARTNIANQCYDFACQLSQLGRIEFGLHILEAGFNWGLTAFDWAKEDKELANLRKDPRFLPLVNKWQSGKVALGSIPFDDVVYLTKAGRTLDGTKKPESKPASRPAEGK